jgi:DNA-binding beta-propeller fold protein YncE
MLFKLQLNFFLYSVVCLLLSCDDKVAHYKGDTISDKSFTDTSIRSTEILYNFLVPDKKYFLPDELEEISGIACLDSEKIACIQDEEGKLYVYNLNEKKIESKTKFAKTGDYEDLTIFNNQVYVLKSNGHLYNFSWTTDKEVVATKIETPLSTDNDVEGLCYDIAGERLLLACKGNKGADGNKIKYKAVFAYDLKSKTFNEEPVYKIDEKKLANFLAEKQIPVKDKIVFKPSGIAIHPISGNVYMIASEGNLLLVLDKGGNFKDVATLPAKVFKQPEGIGFLPDGTLFISNEGRGGSGNILKFLYLNR